MKSQQFGKSPYEIITPLPQKLEWLSFGEIKPAGWLKTQMQHDMNGFTGHLGELIPDLMADSIYGINRLTHAVKSKNVGNIGIEMDPQYLWWNSETQSNWRDGYIRNAILLDDTTYMGISEKYIHNILSTQDVNGYLGIYATDLRYNFQDENGELWAKTTLLRGLLAWYEYTQKSEVLNAIKKAVADVMANYPDGGSSPFKSAKPSAGGVTHGLVFTDVLDRLYQITGDKTYLNYALFLYRDFSANFLNEDGQYAKIVDTAYKLKEHGVHTYEHLRSLTMAWYASGNPALKSALDIYLRRIQECTTPTGGPIGDEWIGGKLADATHTGYEYCSLHELMDGYCNLLQKTGEVKFGDKIENLFFNAAQGARHPDQSCIAYCKTDNSYSMTGAKFGEPNADGKQTRFKYSPAHQDVAVCCVPNAGRISPCFVKSMWMKDSDGLIASLLGPNQVQTMVKGVKVSIFEETDYPFDNAVRFQVSVDHPIDFVLKIRRPAWVKKISLNCGYTERDGFIIIDKTWQGKETIQLALHHEIEIKQDRNQEYYYTYGALVFSLPIKSREIVSKVFPVDGFKDLQYVPVNLERYQYYHDNKPEIEFSHSAGSEKMRQDITLKTTLVNASTGLTERVLLRPVGETILRQTTFRLPPLHVTTGRVIRFEKFPSRFVDARNVDVWLPDGYDPKKRYAVLYMHDGQMLYDSTTTWNKQVWEIDEVMGKLLKKKEIRDCIVVGVWNTGQYRHIEYFPQKPFNSLTPEEKADILTSNQGDKNKKLMFDGPISDNYLNFLVKELKPAIDSSFSTLTDQKNTFVAGSSMGGLISMYAICEYPGIFGGAACLSTHWPGIIKVSENPIPAAFMTYLKEHLPSPKDHKIYFDYGSETLDSLYKPYQQQADVIMKSKGYTFKNWMTRAFPGENHSEQAWRKRLDIPVVFLLGR